MATTVKILSATPPATSPLTPQTRQWVIVANRLSYRLCKYWFLVFLVGFGIWVGLPFLAPVFMHWGWTLPARAIYTLFSYLCHQLAERSFFLFGPKGMYSLTDLQAAHLNAQSMLALRNFLGSQALGWKVAWSDRMVAMFGGIWLLALLWWPLRKRLRPIPWWLLGLLLLPMAVDGSTHFLSDLAGLGQGFRDSNAWLAILTNQSLPATFYKGDALGSFNLLMRLWSGLVFAVGIVFLGFPYLYGYFRDMAEYLRVKYLRAGIDL
ncbi:MAG: DUF2085 domain-containing protein [Anaerolineaceae bacterium]|nr:DUF2085 domain-containing protein [Anaerolineaceae bacterium]